MKKIISCLLAILMITSMLPVFAAVVDDSTDGFIDWCGYRWDAECLTDEAVGTSQIYDTQPCPHGWLYLDDEGCINFRTVPPEVSGEKETRHHRIEIERNIDTPDNNQINWGKSFDVEFDMQTLDYGEGFGLQFYDANMRIYLVFQFDGIIYQAHDKYYFRNIGLDKEWHRWRCEKRETQFTLYMDGDVIVSYKVPTLSTPDTRNGSIRFYASPSTNVAPSFKLRNLTVQNYEDVISMTPAYNQTYSAGDDVVLKADVTNSPDYVDYYIGEVLVGTATSATNYAYTMKKPAVGSYIVRAESSSGEYTYERNFFVLNNQNVTLSLDETISYGDSAQMSLGNISGVEVDYVNYYVNGISCGTATDSPYSISVSDLPVGTSSVYGMVYLTDGTYIYTDTEYVDVETSTAGSFPVKREYDVSYTYTSGNGAVDVNDGFFRLSMSHTDGGLTYITRDGTETYTGGAGVFRAVVASGIADVYRNGQLAFSFCMPRSSNATGLSFSGVSDLSLGGSGQKTEVFHKDLSGETSITDESINNGLFYSIEFDKKDTSGESILVYDGEYVISMKFNGGITVMTQPETEVEPYEQTLADDFEAGYYRITVNRGISQLFCNNKFVGSFRAPREAHKKTLRRVMSKGGQTSFVAIKNTDDMFYFEEDFDGNGEREPLEYWYKVYGDVDPAVSDAALNLSGNGVFLFDATAENPKINWNMALKLTEETTTVSGSDNGICEGGSGGTTTTTTKSGEFGVALRYRTEKNNIKVKYNHNGGVWTIVETVDGTATTLATAVCELTNETAYDYKLSVVDDMLSLNCGSTTVFSNVKLNLLGNGKIGFVPISAESATIDNFSYAGNGKPNTGVNYSMWKENEFTGTVDFYEGPNEGEVVAHQLGKYYSTTDKGATWTGPTEAVPTGTHTLKLQSGNTLRISHWGGQGHANLYDPENNVLSSNVSMQEDKALDRHAMGGRTIQALKVWGTAPDASPRVFHITTQGSEVNGVTTVYYSDDEGRSWHQSKTIMDYENLGNFYGGESDIVELPDGRIRVYFRCDRGFLYYVDSYDGGVNFGNEPIVTQFITPSTAFAVERDDINPNRYYMYWSYDVTTAALSYHQNPRNRVALAVSYDGCESWEYIMETDDQGINPSTTHCNSSMRVFDGILYVNFGYLTDGGYKFADDLVLKQMILVVDPSKMTTVQRFADAHYVKPDFTTVYDESPKQVVIPKETGTAMIYDNMVPVRVKDGMVETSVVARAMAAEYAETATGATFTIADGVVEFVKGSTEYRINGNAYIAAEVYMSADGDYIDPEFCSGIFGKVYKETTSTMMLLATTLPSNYTTELEQLVAGVPESLELCIEAFKAVSNVSELKKFFEDYKVLLNLYTDFTDTSFANMYAAYIKLDMDGIVDYETMSEAIDALIAAEKGRVGEFLDALNDAVENNDFARIEDYLTETYADLLSITVDTSELKDSAAVFKKMTGLVYSSVGDVEAVYLAAYESQLYHETGKSNSISMSTVSRGFEGWNKLTTDEVGGYSIDDVDGEKVVTLSAYEGKKKTSKTAVEPSVDCVVYQEPGVFGANAVGNAANDDSETGTISFDENDGNFTISGDRAADSYTMVTVFNMTKLKGLITGKFTSGSKTVEVEFTEKGTSLGELPEELANADELTYRVELSMGNATIYAKPAGTADTEYVLIGEGANSSITKTNWSVKFVADAATTTISEIGIYSGLSGVRYDVGGMTLDESAYYSVDGGAGHTMADLVNDERGLFSNNVTVDENGKLVLAKNVIDNGDGTTTTEDNAVVYLEKLVPDGFDRCELDFTMSVETAKYMFFYYADSSGFRHGTNYFSPDRFNNVSNGYSSKWTTDVFYDFKLITNICGYDADGQARTSVNMYVKKKGETKWVCVAQEQVYTVGQKLGDLKPQIKFMNTHAGSKIVFENISMKTYTRDAGNYEYLNTAVNMPTVDYNFSFDYMRMDADTPTTFTIGGNDYSQTFDLMYYRIYSDTTKSVVADFDIDEDRWYRFFGSVKITPESSYANDKTKTFKNLINLYMMDDEGNVYTLFEDLPMLKTAGKGGIRFEMKDTSYAGIRLKNVRVYNGKALDLVSYASNGEAMTVVTDFLNNEEAMTEDGIVLVGVYDGDALIGAGTNDFTEDVDSYGSHRITINDINYSGAEPWLKVFMWKDLTKLVPITTPTESR